MQTARRKLAGAARYGRDLLELASWLSGEDRIQDLADGHGKKTLLIALGSDRGLCGPFNRQVAEALQGQEKQIRDQGGETRLWALGMRLRSPLAQMEISPDYEERFASGSVPDYQQTYFLAERIRAEVQEEHCGRVLVVFNRLVRANQARPVVEQLVPVELKGFHDGVEEKSWPRPIVETDPEGLLERIRLQAVEINLYRYLLSSSAAEHAIRFHLLEDAAQNMDRLIEELEMDIQLARQQAITTEMMDLIAAAGLLKS
jgi:F-type H+-transporting ATPase subunit gamma